MKFLNANKCTFIILSLILFDLAYSDLPVNCKREQIQGMWTFRISNEKFDADLKNPKITCGHNFPDQIDKTVGDSIYSFPSHFEVEVTLVSDYKVYENNVVVGSWTPIFNEGFIVNYKNSIFTAFMKYYKKDNSPEYENKDYISNCDKTMKGWYIPDYNYNNKNWSCFYGLKSHLLTSPPEHKFLNPFPQAPSVSVFLELNIKASEYAKVKLMSMMYDEQIDLVNQVNALDLGWKANIHEEFKGLSFFELKEKLGLLREKKITNADEDFLYKNNFEVSNQPSYLQKNDIAQDTLTSILGSLGGVGNIDMPTENNNYLYDTPDFNNSPKGTINNDNLYNIEEDSRYVTDYAITSKYINKELNEIDINTLPKNWDWRNVGGVNYVPKPRLQLNCGSCYIFSMVSSLESRLRILTNNEDTTLFSRQFPLACSFYTEGCKGGYPIFVAKFFNEFEIIPESCFQYNPDKVDCSNVCDYTKNPRKYFVTKYGYLGGFYGATSEEDIMKELRARGPIPGNMSVPLGFSYYKNGIFSQNKLKENAGHISNSTLFNKNISWSNVDHSILLVGYGEENGVKYWIGMNTWGEKWGENGYFRILRGENDCNIETMGDYARISFKDHNN
jgi:C1A family cysteine protease